MLLFAILLAACGQSGGEDEANAEVDEDVTEEIEETIEEVVEEIIDPLKVFTTLFPLEDFTERIGGEYVEVSNIIPAGADAHSFEPTANQMIQIAEADLFIYNGAGFEGFAERIKETVESHNVTVITAAKGIELIDYHHDHDHDHGHSHDDDHGHTHEDDDHTHEDDDHTHEEDEHGHDNDHGHSHGEEDPHVWLDPIRAITLAENIKNALVELLPEAAEVFEENFEVLMVELEQLDQEFVAMAEEITKDTIVVSHAGYGYWEDRYGIHQVGIAGISPTNEPTIKQIQDIIHYMEKNDINYIMFEQNIPVRIAETVREEVGAEALWIHNLETLMQEDVDNGEDYFSLMRKNIETLRTALQ